AQAVAAEKLETQPGSFIFGQLRSDYANFVLRGHVPTVFFSDSTGGCYHTTGGTFDVVDTTKLATRSRIGVRLTPAPPPPPAPGAGGVRRRGQRQPRGQAVPPRSVAVHPRGSGGAPSGAA